MCSMEVLVDMEKFKKQMELNSIPYTEEKICGYKALIGYEKKFRWTWLATQLNTFLVTIDLGDTQISIENIEAILASSFVYAKKNYHGWPRGLQSGVGVLVIIVSSSVSKEAIEYCEESKAGKKWAGFSVPVLIDSLTEQKYHFKKNPIWGLIYYPYFKDLINKITHNDCQ